MWRLMTVVRPDALEKDLKMWRVVRAFWPGSTERPWSLRRTEQLNVDRLIQRSVGIGHGDTTLGLTRKLFSSCGECHAPKFVTHWSTATERLRRSCPAYS